MANFVWQSSVWRCRIIESTGRIDMTFADLHFSQPLSRRHIEQKSSRQRSFSLVRTKALRIDESARRDIRIFYENGLFHRSDGLPSSLLSSGHVVQFSPTQAFQLLYPLTKTMQVLWRGPVQYHYLKNVMRVSEGSEVKVFDGVNGEWWCKLSAGSSKIGCSGGASILSTDSQVNLIILFGSILHRCSHRANTPASWWTELMAFVRAGQRRSVGHDCAKSNGAGWEACCSLWLTASIDGEFSSIMLSFYGQVPRSFCPW